MGDKIFIEITNQNIYDKLIEIENHIKATNGKVKLNRWIGTTALACVIALTGIFVNYLAQGG